MPTFRVGAMVGLGSFGLAFLAYGVAMAVSGEWLTAAVAVASSGFWLFGALIWAVIPTSVPSASADESGMIIRPDQRIDRYMRIMLISCVIGFGGIGVFGVLGWLKFPLPDATDIVRMVCLAWIGPALVSVVALWIIARRGSLTRVRLTTTGFEFAERFTTRRGEWAEVVDVSNEAPDKPQATSPLVVSMADGSTVMLMESALVAPRDALYTLMKHLWRHPDARAELTDGRAVARLQAL